MRPFRIEERVVEARDGTRLASHAIGVGPDIVLCNGLGGSYRAWAHQITHLSGHYRFVSWDYRGLYGSEAPREPGALRVGDHADDALRVMDAYAIERATLAGWSMGVQVALEVFRRAPERVASLVLMNGVAGRPWEEMIELRGVGRRVVPPSLRAARTVPWLVKSVVDNLVRWPETIDWLQRLGVAAPTLDRDLFFELAASFGQIDLETYIRILELLGEHDASDVLPDVDVPTLVVTGDRDRFTPRRAAERMAAAVPGSELLVVRGGTHYAAVEYPELVSLRIEKFLRERGSPKARP